MAGPRASLNGPLAAPPRLGLVAQAAVDTSAERWESGFSYNPEACGDAAGVADPCESNARNVDRADANPDLVEVEPFAVWAADTCSALDRGRDWQGRVRRQLEACRSKQIEAEFWAGTLATAEGWPNRFLRSEDSDVVTAGGTTPVAALACLEQGLADCKCGGRGMIHATPQLVTHWANTGLVRREGNQLLTYLDTIVVAGEGYTGDGPLASDTSNVWAYATGLVQIRLGAIEVYGGLTADGVDRSDNTMTAYADQLAAVAWDGCCHLAAEVDLDRCGIGGS